MAVNMSDVCLLTDISSVVVSENVKTYSSGDLHYKEYLKGPM